MSEQLYNEDPASFDEDDLTDDELNDMAEAYEGSEYQEEIIGTSLGYSTQDDWNVSSPITSEPPASTLTFETLGRNFLVNAPNNYFVRYEQYLRGLYGKYDETTGQWSFPASREKDVREVLSGIISGQLLPPDMLSAPVGIDVTSNQTAYTPAPIYETQTQINTQVVLPPAEEKQRRRQQTQTETSRASLPPSQIVASMPASNIPISAPAVIGDINTNIPVPTYNPLEKELGESGDLYTRRIALYQMLVNYTLPSGQRIPPDTADLLSRMRNNVDMLGVEYNPAVMNVLNMYLPLSPSGS